MWSAWPEPQKSPAALLPLPIDKRPVPPGNESDPEARTRRYGRCSTPAGSATHESQLSLASPRGLPHRPVCRRRPEALALAPPSDGPRRNLETSEALVQQLQDQFEGDRGAIRRDVEQFLRELETDGLVTLQSADPPA